MTRRGSCFDPEDPAYDPAALPRFTLSKPPYPGPRRVRLVTGAGDRIALGEREVIWDEVDGRRFTLAPARTRDLAGVEAVQVLYGVIAVFTVVKFNQVMSVVLRGGRCRAAGTLRGLGDRGDRAEPPGAAGCVGGRVR